MQPSLLSQVEKAEKALEAAEKHNKSTKAKMDDKEDALKQAKTVLEKNGCRAQVLKWRGKLKAANDAVVKAEEVRDLAGG